MDEAGQLESSSTSAEMNADLFQLTQVEIRAEKVERAAADLYADFERQCGLLKQSQFDRLVLRRNLTPQEMIALIAKLATLACG